MKTYKTWEAIKMLSENNKLKFECDGVKLDVDDGYLRGTYNNRKGLDDNICLDNDSDDDLNDKWELVQPSVTFTEAITAWANEKTVKCTHCGRTFIYIGLKHHAMVDEKGNPLSKAAINYGKWFIEQSND